MASNEHANLSEGNLHNPKGLSLADNNTVCSKSNTGTLVWSAKSGIKTDIHTFAGYCTLDANYQYPEAQIYGQSPYDINQNYGSATISSSTTVVQKKFFRIANHLTGCDGVVNKCVLQITNNSEASFTVALVKYTPSASSSNSYPVVLFEKEVTGSSDNIVVSYDIALTDFTNTTVSKGDHMFLMAKAGDESAENIAYIAVALEVGSTDYTY